MSEQIYDEKIAPVLMDLMKLCNANGMPFVAQVEYEPGEFCSSAELPQGRSLPMDLMYVAGRCRGNVDSLIGWIVNYAKEHGHSSVYLKMLGVPLQPNSDETSSEIN